MTLFVVALSRPRIFYVPVLFHSQFALISAVYANLRGECEEFGGKADSHDRSDSCCAPQRSRRNLYHTLSSDSLASIKDTKLRKA